MVGRMGSARRTLSVDGMLLDEGFPRETLPAVATDSMDLEVQLTPSEGGMRLESAGTLSFTVQRGPLSGFVLVAPRGAERLFIEGVESTRMTDRHIWVRLTSPVPVGETVTLNLTWSNAYAVDGASVSTFPANGVQLTDWLPAVWPRTGRRTFQGQLTVRRPRSWFVNVSVAGETRQTTAADGAAIVLDSVIRAPQVPVLTLGPWKERVASEPPMVRGFATPAKADSLWAFAQLVDERAPVFAQMAGPWPCEEVDFVPLGAEDNFTWHTVGCVITTRPTRIDGTTMAALDNSHGGSFLAWALTHEIAHLYWGVWVNTSLLADRWWLEALAEYGACQMVAEEKGDETCSSALDARHHDEQTPWPSERGADSAVRRYHGGLWVMEYVRARIGTPAMNAALRDFTEAHRHGVATAKDLREALERSGGVPLAAAFGALANSGQRPTVRLEQDRKLGLCAVTVQPGMGRLDVPVQVGQTMQWVTTTDGQGQLPCTQRARLDPDGVLPRQ
ncbi:MAG: hypothetical protein AAFV53_18110 [Myxococcota bacterium]